MISKTDIYLETKVFFSNHKVLSFCMLGLAIVGIFSLGKFAGRTISWIRTGFGTTQKTNEVAQNSLSPPAYFSNSHVNHNGAGKGAPIIPSSPSLNNGGAHGQESNGNISVQKHPTANKTQSIARSISQPFIQPNRSPSSAPPSAQKDVFIPGDKAFEQRVAFLRHEAIEMLKTRNEYSSPVSATVYYPTSQEESYLFGQFKLAFGDSYRVVLDHGQYGQEPPRISVEKLH